MQGIKTDVLRPSAPASGQHSDPQDAMAKLQASVVHKRIYRNMSQPNDHQRLPVQSLYISTRPADDAGRFSVAQLKR